MKKYLLIGLLFLLNVILYSCINDFHNKPKYEIKVGETFDLYVAENSCCSNCWINELSMKSITLVKHKLVSKPWFAKGGGTYYYAWVFKGIKVGVDTIKIVNLAIGSGENCRDYKEASSYNKPVIFVVNVIK